MATEPHKVAGVAARSTESTDPRIAAADRRWNRIAIAAFITALVGFPTFGLISGATGAIVGCVGLLLGVIAIIVACIALVGHRTGRRGFVLGVVAIVLGLFDVVGGSIGLSTSINPAGRAAVAMDELTIDPESLKELPERIARAMRANVVIESVAGIGGRAIGSGVIMQIRDGVAHIVTNRHTVDFSYTGAVRPEPPELDELSNIQVVTVGQVPVKAKVEWIAPHGVDLAIISAPVLAEEVQEAHWDPDATPHVGDTVFAVGNPHGLGWSHSAGDISQVRRQRHGEYSFRMLQTTAAINPGNSGGGLYDAEGRLIGINTMTGDKRFAEGLGFSIALPTLFDLLPKNMEIPSKNPDKED
jgi:S1-C subfamily serine protease